MAKLIKRDQRETLSRPEPGGPTPTEGGDEQTAADAPGRHGQDIDPEAFEARSEAATIKERAEAEAEAIVATARAEAERLAQAAAADVDRLRGEAEAAGREAGQQQGLEALMAAAARLSGAVEAMQAELGPQVVTLSMAIARRIIGRELEFQPETVVQIVKQALSDKARQRREITLRVHPDDAKLVRESRPVLTEMLSRTKEIAIQEDPEVARHGVVIETEAGVIDAQLEVQLGALERALKMVEATP